MLPSIDDPLFTKNMTYFRLAFPEVAEILATCRLDPRRLFPVGDDDWDLLLDDLSRLYGCGSREHARAQAEAFWADVEPHRLTYPPPRNLDVDKMANEFVTTCLRQAVEAGVQFYQNRCDNSAANVIVYGVGLGQHLSDLVTRSECESVMLIEPEVDFFFCSLFTFNWGVFVESVRARGGEVAILLAHDPSATAFTIMSWLNNRYPSLIDGTLFYGHYDSEVFGEIRRQFAEVYSIQAIMGLGFVEDELCMINNTVRNLEHFEGPVFRRNAPARQLPAFIVGSGPSLDRSIETVRRYRDRALIISCGTALEVMLQQGVVPDIHTALENVPEAYDSLARCAAGHDIGKIMLIASTTVDPRIPSLFDTTIFFVRGGVASYPLFTLGEDTILHNVAPMVSNLALTFAREAGCRRIHLFGIDLGSPDAAMHHSKDSPYMQGDLDYVAQNKYEMEGNFGGTMLGSFIHVQSRTMKELEISEHGQGVAYFNCSDGVKIKGMLPLRPEDLDLAAISETKDEFKKAMLDHFIRYERTLFERHWSERRLVPALDAFKDRLLAAIDASGDGYIEAVRMLRQVTRIASTQDTWKRPTEELLFRGTLCLAMGVANYLLTRTGNTDDRRRFSAIVKENLRSLVVLAHTVIQFKYEELGQE